MSREERKFYTELNKLWAAVLKFNWKNPKNILLLCCLALIPFVSGIYLMMGLWTGALLALAAMLIIDKLPIFAKRWCRDHALLADILFSTLMAVLVGKFFAAGLTLLVGTAVCAVILSIALPLIYIPEPEIVRPETAAA